jgi:uncharacterized NAD-dependent epimerase/dehydratase family protein
MYGAETVAVTVNTGNMTAEEGAAYASSLSKQLNIPVVLPLEQGVDTLVPVFKNIINQYKH